MQKAADDTTVILEGKTKLVVPSQADLRRIPYFFNPKGALVRNISIVCYDAFSKLRAPTNLSFADSLAGIGARGVRVANEINAVSDVFMNDVNSRALALAKQSANLNGVEERCTFSRSEASSFLSSKLYNDDRFDIVDLDPFGTPSQFVDCVVRATRHDGLISMTATDSAVLCGVYPKVSLRKYLGLPLRTDYCHEVGLRLMFGLLAMTAMRLETGIVPLFAHHDIHYFRIYAQLKVGNKHSIENETNIGYVLHCFKCGWRQTIPRLEFDSIRKIVQDLVSLSEGNLICPNCKIIGATSTLKVGGPCWIGKIQSKEFLKKCLEISYLPIFSPDELDIPLYYDLTYLSQELGIRTPKITAVMSELESGGFRVSRTRLNPKALRTDASLPHLLSLVSRLAL